mmetsp:Transcript_23026/g.48266  ORF Transcript_23026/g.48266 Transcript_23026/m.48266 type:complete len:1237 (-) Transcript_23026:115-3825(-)|eukprot:CAMPEP_0172188716 /NCGR_PEP_ID=MMETSP1050-20130122/22106_1 /TAXON_ID=233186 /ORGANISM="Cryptomonas curvata, Strain CCAP979/52" /LENGTH=1236 /DNA_ID=CAMNT_0012863297 /DNA_START=86 /DNA_END=3796 /DNA_ORIENTATION=-
MDKLGLGNEELIFVQEDGLGLRVASSHTGRNSRNEEKCCPSDDPEELFPAEQEKNESVGSQGDSDAAVIHVHVINNGWTIFPKGDEFSVVDDPEQTPTQQDAKGSQSALLPANRATNPPVSSKMPPLKEPGGNNDRIQTGKLPAKLDVSQRTSKPRLNVKSSASSERKPHEIPIKQSNSGKEDTPLILKSNPEKPGSKNTVERNPVHRKKIDLSSPLSARGSSTSQQQKDCRLLTFRSSTVSKRNDSHLSNQHSSRSEPQSLHSAAASPLESHKSKASDPLVSHLEFIIAKMDSLHPKLRVSPLSTLARPWHADKTKAHVLSQEHVSALSIAVGGATLPRPPWNDSTLPDPIIRRGAGGDRRVRTSKDSNVPEGVPKHPIQNGDTLSASEEEQNAVGVSESDLNADVDQKGHDCLTADVGDSEAPTVSAEAPSSIPPTDTNGMKNLANTEIQAASEEERYDNDDADFENEDNLDSTAAAASKMVQPPQEIEFSNSQARNSDLATQDAGLSDFLRPASAKLPGKSERIDEPKCSEEQGYVDPSGADKVVTLHDTHEIEVANCLLGADPMKRGSDAGELGVVTEEFERVNHGQECYSKSKPSESPTFGPVLSVSGSQVGSRPASVMTVGSAEDSNDEAKSRQSVRQDEDASPIIMSRPGSRQVQRQMSEVDHNEDTEEDFADFVDGGNIDRVEQGNGLVEVIDGVDFDWTVQPNQTVVDDHSESPGLSSVANKNADLNGSMEIGDEAGEYHSDFDAIDEPVHANDARSVEGNNIIAQNKQGSNACGDKGSDSEAESSQTKNGEGNKGLEQEGSKQFTSNAKSSSCTNEPIFAEAAIVETPTIGTEELNNLESDVVFPEEQAVSSQGGNCDVVVLRNPSPDDSTLIPEQEKGQPVLDKTESDGIARPPCQSPCTETTVMEDPKGLFCSSISKSVDDADNPSTEDSCIHVTPQAKDRDTDKVQEDLNDRHVSLNTSLGSNEAQTGGYDLDFEDVDHPTECSGMGNADCTGLLLDTLGSSCKAQSTSDTGHAHFDQVESGSGEKQLLMDGHLIEKKNADSEKDILAQDKKAPIAANSSDKKHVEGQQPIPIQLSVNSDSLPVLQHVFHGNSSSIPAVKDDISESNLETESQEHTTSAQIDTVLTSKTIFSGELDIQSKVLNIDDTGETNHDKMEFPFDDVKGQFENGRVEVANDDIADVQGESCPVAYEDSWEGEDAQPYDDTGQKTEFEVDQELGPALVQ